MGNFKEKRGKPRGKTVNGENGYNKCQTKYGVTDRFKLDKGDARYTGW